MTRQLHDQFAKEYLEELLTSLGSVETSKKVRSEIREIDVWFSHQDYLLEILASWRRNMEMNSNLSDEDRELMMALSPAYLRQREVWRKEGLQEGLQTGLQTGRQEELRLMVVSLLTARFGSLDA